MSRTTVIPESEVMRQAIEAAALFGVVLERQNTGVGTYPNADGTTRQVRYGKPGASDLRGVLPDGRALAVETKRKGKRPTREQWNRIHEINASNGVAFFIDDAEQITRVLPLLMQGCRVETDAAGRQWITDEPEGVDRCRAKPQSRASATPAGPRSGRRPASSSSSRPGCSRGSTPKSGGIG